MQNQLQSEQGMVAAPATPNVGAVPPDSAHPVRRAVAFSIDSLIVLIFFMELFHGIVLLLLPYYSMVASWEIFALVISVYSLYQGLCLTRVFYAGVFHSSWWQATPGDFIAGVKVVDQDRQRIGFFLACSRQLSAPFFGIINILRALALMVIGRPADHDRVNDTLVIRPCRPRRQCLLACCVSIMLLAGVLWVSVFPVISGGWREFPAISGWKSVMEVRRHWLVAKEVLLQEEHAHLSGWLLKFAKNNRRCPTTRDFNTDKKAPEEMGDLIPSFRKVEFNPVGASSCLLTATLAVAWQSEWSGREVFYRFHRETGEVTCDAIFLQVSPKRCLPSIQKIGPGGD